MQLYSAAILCEKPRLSFGFFDGFILISAAIMAQNDNEALGKALHYAREIKYPIKQGYSGHQCYIHTIPHDWLLSNAKIYAAAICASKSLSFQLTGDYKCEFNPVSLIANTDDEALGKAITYAKDTKFPTSLGYLDHHAHIFAVPPEWITQYVSQFQLKAP